MSVCIGVPNFIQIQQVRTAELCMTSTLSRYRTDVLALKRHWDTKVWAGIRGCHFRIGIS